MNHLSERELDARLSEWRADLPQEDPRLSVHVWRRIALRESREPARPWWTAVCARLAARPAFALALILVFALAGLVLGEARLQQERAVSSEILETRYFRAIDPVSMASHRHPE